MMTYIFQYSDLIPYGILICIGLLCYNLPNKKKGYNLYTIFLFLFSSVRYGIGFDYYAYVDRIHNFDGIGYEWLSDFFLYIAHISGCDQLFFVINAFIVIFSVRLLCIRLSMNPMLALMGFVLLPMFYIDSFSIVRNASAISVCALGMSYLLEKKYLMYFSLLFIGAGLHNASYICLLYLIVIFLKSSKRINWLLCIIGSFLLLVDFGDIFMIFINRIGFSNSIIQYKLLNYVTNATAQGNFYKYLVILLSIASVLTFDTVSSLLHKKMILMSSLGMFLWGLFSFDHTLSLRFSAYFLIFQVVILSNYLFILRKSVIRLGYLLFLHLIFISLFYVNISQYKGDAFSKISFLPYQTVFNHIDYSNYKLY